VEIWQWRRREGALCTAEGSERGDVLGDYLWMLESGFQVAAGLVMLSTGVSESSTELYYV